MTTLLVQQALSATPLSLLKSDLATVANAFEATHNALQEATDSRQSGTLAALSIIKERAENPLVELQALEEENARLRELVYGKFGVLQALDIFEKEYAISANSEFSFLPSFKAEAQFIKDARLGTPVHASYQERVAPWALACFGKEVADNKRERNHRFLEESVELVQASGTTEQEAHQLVSYVYGRPVGELKQEVGGVMVTLACLCRVQDLDMHEAGEMELSRIWSKVAEIRVKNANKPNFSLLASATGALPTQDTALLDWLQEEVVDVIYMDDHTVINIQGNNVRQAIEAVKQRKQLISTVE